ncbi:MAG: V-type ATP synthase subunit D [Candidatus Scalindua sp. AMX11]|nr:MAG: V-type ATP synthase subunit D [Candidatus Scalindua sp.]NOG83084.1 V-type ATP synthase subunit D [Planctomycetota bacterium]RZV63118.1 MAG: V-type ATP synthase subunit D [Candidatus Scalindua sp. SCAELEC01]TDE63352.1 MAG: V-type ATP synthase subunit D [Candidatus Scalindua sp. AMX11]GJQ57377.1 MAG: ATP synthase subunit D [Candidatus Scalindua sp.]
MQKIKLTKTELRKHKNHLKRFNRYLPILYIKKQQLQNVIEMVKIELKRVTAECSKLREEMIPWIGLLGEEVGLSDLLSIKKIETRVENIAGVDVPVFVTAHIERREYDLFLTPLWVDSAVVVMSEILSLQAEEFILSERLCSLERELTVTSQRVNLFEKVKIPEAKETVRKILIFLGDQQTSAMGWARIAKKKLKEAE